MNGRQPRSSKIRVSVSDHGDDSPKSNRGADDLLKKMASLDRECEGPQTNAKRETLRETARAQGASLISLTITEGPVPDPVMDALPQAVLRQIAAVTEAMYTRPVAQLEKLRAMVGEHPRVPVLRNHLAVALSYAGDDAEAERVIAACAAEFPDYVFGVCNYVLMLVKQGRIDEARAVMEDGPRGPRLILSSFDAGRDTYHITEAATHAAAAGHYLLAIGRVEEAAKNLEILAQIAPESSQFVTLAAAVIGKATPVKKVTRRRGRWEKT